MYAVRRPDHRPEGLLTIDCDVGDGSLSGAAVVGVERQHASNLLLGREALLDRAQLSTASLTSSCQTVTSRLSRRRRLVFDEISTFLIQSYLSCVVTTDW